MATILTARKYERISGIRRQGYPLRLKEDFPTVPLFEVGNVYEWSDSSIQASAQVWVDTSQTKAFISYGCD